MEKEKISFDKKNCTLFIDSMELCTNEKISKWVNSHISDVLDSEISRSYLTGKLEINVMIVCKDYLVALYRISDGATDELIIQSVGYDKALKQSEAEKENPGAEKENPGTEKENPEAEKENPEADFSQNYLKIYYINHQNNHRLKYDNIRFQNQV